MAILEPRRSLGRRRGLLLPLVLFGLIGSPARAETPRYTVEKLADGVHAVLYNPEVEVEGNTLIVINDADVVVVDSNAGVTTAKMTIDEIRKLTPKPVAFVVNTHWHDDHVMGNQAYADVYPGVKFIAHPLTRQDIVDHAFANNAYVVDLIASDITRLRGYLDTGIGRDGKPLTPEMRTRVQTGYDKRIEMLADRKTFRSVPPTVDVERSMTLDRGTRKIEIRFLGRGNTRGDLIVSLPKEKIVATGDLVVAPIPYATNAYAQEWVKTLDKLMSIPATTILPGHGPVMRDWTYVKKVKGALEQTIAAVAAAKKEGLTLPQTTERVQLPELRDTFVEGVELRRQGYEAFFRTSLVRNVWEELDRDVMSAAEQVAPKKASDGVYRLGSVSAYVNEKDVVLAGVPASAAVARATVRALRELTDKTVRYVVLTTAASDPALAVFREAYAQADIVGGSASGATIAVGDVMTLHRGDREIRITRTANGSLDVAVRYLAERNTSSTRSRSCAAVNGLGRRAELVSVAALARSW
jgi:cyclase